MLAYIFWHWPELEVDPAAYERDAADYHRALGATAPAGFRGSWTFRIGSLPWLAAVDGLYEDCYLVDDFAALGPLNDAAVSGTCREPHNRLARAAAGGAGALYRLRAGEPNVPESRFAAWLVKGKQTGYEEFDSLLEPLTRRPGVSLWRRQMVLGPAPEFWLLSPEQPETPARFETLVETRDPLR